MTSEEIVGEHYATALREGFSKSDGYSGIYLIGALDEATTELSGSIWGHERALARAHAIIAIYHEVSEVRRNSDDIVGAL